MIHLEVIRIVNHQNYFVVLPVQHAQPVYVQIKQLLTITAVVTIYIFVDQAKCATILNASQNVKIAQQQIQTAFVEKVEKIFVNQAKCATILNASQNVKIAQQQIQAAFVEKVEKIFVKKDNIVIFATILVQQHFQIKKNQMKQLSLKLEQYLLLLFLFLVPCFSFVYELKTK